MVEASVLMLFTRLAPKIEKAVRGEVCLILNANDEAKKLSSKLKKIQEVLINAEQKAVMDLKVKGWLDKLQDISYDMDAVLDEWDLQNLKLEAENASELSDSPDSLLQKVSSFLQSACLCLRENWEYRTMAVEIKKLNERLDSIDQENENEFKFLPNLSRESQVVTRIESTSVVDVTEVHGRDDDLNSLMKKLLPSSEGEDAIQIQSKKKEDAIQICSLDGAGGIGKTTLAQLAFNHDRLKGLFDVKIWVCVSHPFDQIKIAKAILEAVNGSSPNLSQFEAFLQRIKDSVSGKKFLLVLDDVWTNDDTMWRPLKTSLIQSGAPGSRILLTTRNKEVAKIMGSNQMQQLDPLSDSSCWLFLSQVAFHGRNEGDRAMLEEIGKKIALKCKGLPLAAKIVGSLLRSKISLEEWENVLNSELFDKMVRDGVFPLLELSYNELHPLVKRCLSYCAIFPKDSVIDVEELIRSWMANGFISSSEIEGKMEIKGRDFFNNLANRSFFQDFNVHPDMEHHIIFCKMHDLIHDFIQGRTNEQCLIVEKTAGEARRNENARHLNILGNEAMNFKDLFSICQPEKLCSILCLRNKIPLDFLSHLKRVRWLRLQDCNLLNIPSEIGDLIHMRYLDLSLNILLKEIPESICNLYNLQALNTKYCSSLSEFPRGFSKLRNLRHLLIYGTERMFFIQGLERLDNLREVDYISYNRTSRNKLGHLQGLNRVGGSLHIEICDLDDTYDHLEEAKRADLKKKIFIYHLTLDFDNSVRKEIIEALEPSPNLQCLDFSSHHLPNWITNLTNLRKLFFRNGHDGIQVLNSLKNLSFLGELNLVNIKWEVLRIEFFGIHTTSSNSTCEILEPSAFPRLKKLCIHFCRELKEWEDIGGDTISISVLPCLEMLQLQSCSELKVLPYRLLRMVSSLKELVISGCRYLQERYRKGTKEWDKISQIPNVHIDS